MLKSIIERFFGGHSGKERSAPSQPATREGADVTECLASDAKPDIPPSSDRQSSLAEGVEFDWDPSQKVVINLPEEEMTVIQAGPGAGKTAVACKRVAQLVEKEHLNASKLLLVSFTRASVKELRDRIESYAKEPVTLAGLKIVTLDSLTWQVVRGIGGESQVEMLKGYEGNIRRFLELVESGDEDILDFLEELEHVVVDEGQDLVGLRAELVLSLIRRLPDHCGVTVFADRAQAIYGWTSDSTTDANTAEPTLVERIVDLGEVPGFASLELEKVHRTRDESLRALYRIGRQRLVGRSASTVDEWRRMKDLIIQNAHGSVGTITEQQLDGQRNVLVLFRTRAEVLAASSWLWDKGIVHSLRMSGVPVRLCPWIGRVFGEFEGTNLALESFNDLWEARIGTPDSGSMTTRDEAWDAMLENAGTRDGRVDIRRLRSLLSRERPPIEFLVDETSIPGPVLGTIHGSKGREAEVVHLMMPQDGYVNDDLEPHAIAEEERVLYVGATRARQTLNVGSSTIQYARTLKGSGRIYRKNRARTGLQVEFGKQRDLDPTSVADEVLSEIEARDLQEWLWQHAVDHVPLRAEYSNDERRYRVLTAYRGEPEQFVGALSKPLQQDLWRLARFAGSNDNEGLRPARTIRHLHMIGVRTVVPDETSRASLRNGYRQSGFLLTPVITGYSMVYYNRN